MEAKEIRPRPAIISGVGRFAPPQDPLKAVFTQEVRDGWQHFRKDEVQRRLSVLNACDSCPNDPTRDWDLRHFRARRAAWETYIFTAFACGMLEGERGKDIRGRLTSKDSGDFRSAMSECEVCWFLAGRMRFPLDPVAPGRNGNILDMKFLLNDQEVGVEVKAPYSEQPSQQFVVGDESHKIMEAMKSANNQFSDEQPNLLCLVPSLCRPMFSHRHDLLRAAYGQSKLFFSVNLETDEDIPPWTEFCPDGKFLNTKLPKKMGSPPTGE
jgi:hypothetical protein